MDAEEPSPPSSSLHSAGSSPSLSSLIVEEVEETIPPEEQLASAFVRHFHAKIEAFRDALVPASPPSPSRASLGEEDVHRRFRELRALFHDNSLALIMVRLSDLLSSTCPCPLNFLVVI